MIIADLKGALSLACVLLVLLVYVPVIGAQDTIPQRVRDYGLPGETIQSITPMRYKGDVYQVYYFVRGSLDDPYGRSLLRNGRDYLEEQGIQALLVTRNDRVVTDQETIRRILLLARTGYMLYHTDLPADVAPIPEGMAEQVGGLRSNPIFAMAFLEQNFRALFHKKREEYTEPLRGMLTAKEGATSPGSGFVEDLVASFEESGNIEDAVDATIRLAKYSSDLRLQALAARSKKLFKNWKKVTSQGRSYLDTPGARIEFANGLEIVGLGARMVMLSDLQIDRAIWLEEYVEHFGQGEPALDRDQLWANALVQKEVESDWVTRGELVLDFVRDKAADLIEQRSAPVLGQMFFENVFKAVGVKNAAYLAARAVSLGTWAISIANLLYGMDDIYNNFTTADRAAELRERFRAGRLELQASAFPIKPGEYDGDLAEAYRTAYLLEALAGIQVLRSYADGIDSSRTIKALADLVSGDEWTEGIRSLRAMADSYEVDAEFRLGHPDLIDRAVELTQTRLATKAVGYYDATLVRMPTPVILHPSESGEILLDIQNTGQASWLPPQDFSLLSTNGENLSIPVSQVLTTEIPAGRVARWDIAVIAPPELGLRSAQFQMAFRGEPFGEKTYALVIVLPEGESDLDPSSLLRQWLEEAKERAQDWLDQYREEMEARLREWLQREADRALSDLVESLQQMCGGVGIAPASVIVGLSLVARARRRRRRDHDGQ